MADNKGVQHVAELGFDLSAVYQQFQELEQFVAQQGIKLRDIAKNNWKIDSNLFDGTKNDKSFSGMNENIKKSAANAKSLGDQIGKMSATEKELLRTYSQSASLQAQITRHRLDGLGTQSKTAQTVREEIQSLYQSYQINQKLTQEEREQLNLAVKKLETAKAAVSIERSDSVVQPSQTRGSSGSPLQMIGTYQLFSLAKKAATETIDTLKEVETSMMEISRVMELTEKQSDSLRTSLFNVAQDMGREFKDTSEIMLRFSQAGYDVADATHMTKTALLAMNTAELDAVSSTNSMIGILKQWKYEASDLGTVIDKLNYTADNNAISTQGLVDGLLKMSSAAKNAKFTFDETVGAMVALTEASGRTGSEVGTALNSMIAYTTRDKSLDVFESMGVDVWADKTTRSLNSVIDIWGDLSKAYKSGGQSMVDILMHQTDMQELFSEEVAHSVGAGEEYNKMLEAQTKLQGNLSESERKMMTEQFGTYRRSMMISLLENYEKIAEVVNDMDAAEGHSARENARYMETYEAKLKQLKTSLQELAVQAGEAGLLDIAKGAVVAATAVTNFTKSIGGLAPVLITVTGLFALLKREKIEKGFIDAIAPIQKTYQEIRTLAKTVKDSGGSFQSFKESMKSTELGLSSFIGIAGGVITVLSLVTMAVSKYKQSQDAKLQNAIGLATAAQDEAKALQGLKKEYLSIIDSMESEEEKTIALNAWKERLAETYGIEAEALNKVNLLRETGIALLDEETIKSSKKALAELGSSYEFAVGFMERAQSLALSTGSMKANDFGGTVSEKSLSRVRDKFKELGVEIEGTGRKMALIFASDGAAEQQGLLESAIAQFRLLENRSFAEEQMLRYLEAEHEQLSKNVDKYQEIYDLGTSAAANIKFNDFMQGFNLEEVFDEASFESFRSSLVDMAGSSDGVAQALERMAYDVFPQYRVGVDSTTDSLAVNKSALEEWSNAVSESVPKVEDLMSSISSLEGTMQSLADGKGLTLDATLDLIDKYPELASAIHFVGDEWYFEADALETLRQAQYLQRAELEATKIAQLAATSGNVELSDAAAELARQMLLATSAEEKMAIMSQFVAIGAGKAARGIDGMAVSAAKLQAIMTTASKPIMTPQTSYRGNSEAIKAETAARNEQTKALQAEQKAVQKAHDAEKKRHQDGLKSFEKTKKAEIDLMKKQQDTAEKSQKAIIDGMKEQQKVAEESYKKQRKAAEDRYSAEIKVLQDLKKEESRTDDEADYKKNRGDLELERADMEKRTGREATERIAAIDKEMENLDEQERRRLRDNNIDDKIALIEEEKNYHMEAMEQVWERQQKQHEKQVELLQAEMEQEKKRVSLEIEGKQALVDAEKERVQLLIDGLTSVWDAQRESFEAQLEALRNVTAANVSSVGLMNEAYGNMATETEENIKNMYGNMTLHGETWRTQSENQGMAVLRMYESISRAVEIASLGFLKLPSFPSLGNYKNDNPPTGGYYGMPSSHTGSVVTRGGAVNVAAGEIIVREDISKGLLRVAEFMNKSVMQPSGGGLNINSPLVVIQKQVISNKTELNNANQELGDTVLGALYKLPR